MPYIRSLIVQMSWSPISWVKACEVQHITLGFDGITYTSGTSVRVVPKSCVQCTWPWQIDLELPFLRKEPAVIRGGCNMMGTYFRGWSPRQGPKVMLGC